MSGQVRAVEVATLLEDSIVEVNYLRTPGTSRPTSAGRIAAAMGILLLATSAYAFVAGVRNAAANRREFREFTDVRGRSHADFRPHRLSPLYDWMAFGGLAGGLAGIAVGAALGRRNAARAEFFADGEPLVGPTADGFVCRLAAGMVGEWIDGGEMVPVAGAVPVPERGRLRLRKGSVTHLVSSVAPPRAEPLWVGARVDPPVALSWLLSAAAHALVVAILFWTPPTPESLSLDASIAGSPPIALAIAPREHALPEPTPGEDGLVTALAVDPVESLRTVGIDTAAGPARAVTAAVSPARLGEPSEVSRSEAIAAARKAGIFSYFAGNDDPFASLAGGSEYRTRGLNDVAGDADIGVPTGDPAGRFGGSLRAFAPGGGTDTIVSGAYATACPGCRPGVGPGGRRGRPLLGTPRQKRLPTVRIGKSSIPLEVDGAILRRYIRRHLAEVRHCYERQLAVEPGLAGTVTTSFMVNDSGAVLSAEASGLGNPAVESCIASVMQSIRFPRSPNAGMYRISYPFVLRAAGE